MRGGTRKTGAYSPAEFTTKRRVLVQSMNYSGKLVGIKLGEISVVFGGEGVDIPSKLKQFFHKLMFLTFTKWTVSGLRLKRSLV